MKTTEYEKHGNVNTVSYENHGILNLWNMKTIEYEKIKIEEDKGKLPHK